MKSEFILSILSLLSIITSTDLNLRNLQDEVETPNIQLNLVNGLYELNIKSGTDLINYLNLILDTSHYITWIPSINCTTCNQINLFNISKAISFKDILTPKTIQYVNGNVSGNLSSSDFFFDKNSTLIGNGYTFVMVNQDTLPENAKLKGIMGFGHNYQKNEQANFSFTDLLIRNKQIDKDIFSIDPNGPKLYIGGLPLAISKDMKNYTHCGVETTGDISNYWSCLLTHYIQGDSKDFSKSTAIRKSVIFDTGNVYSCAPLSFFNTFWTTYFMNKTTCSNMTAPDKTISITCSVDTDYTKFDNLHFILNGWAYNITPSSLFVDNQFTIFFGKCILDDVWTFGNYFLQNFAMVYDRDKEQVGFYTDRRTDFTKYVNEEQDSKNRSWIIIGIIFGIVFFIIIILGILYVIKKYKEKPQFDLTKENKNKENFINY